MDLKEAVAWLTPFDTDIHLTPDHIEAVKTLVNFYNSVLECRGMPDKETMTRIIWERVTNAGKPEGPILESDSEVAADEIYDLFTACIVKMLDVERIEKVIEVYNGEGCDRMTWGEYKRRFALAIVAECKGMPQKKEIPSGFEHLAQYDRDMVWNECCNLWTAYHAKMVDAERIEKVIVSYNEEVNGGKITWEEYKRRFALAIVAELKEK